MATIRINRNIMEFKGKVQKNQGRSSGRINRNIMEFKEDRNLTGVWLSSKN